MRPLGRYRGLLSSLLLFLFWTIVFTSTSGQGELAPQEPSALVEDSAGDAPVLDVDPPLLLDGAAETPFPAGSYDTEGEGDPAVKSQIDKLLSRRTYRRARWGMSVYSLDERRFVYSRNADRLFIPASNAKLFTTSAALVLLGPDFRFRTRLAYEGELRADGVLAGNLVLFGEGDPNLADNLSDRPSQYLYLDEFAQKVRAAGIQVVEGDVIGDDSYFASAAHGSGWKVTDLSTRFGAPISALSFNENLAVLRVRPGKAIGKAARIYLDPVNPYARVRNGVKTEAPGTKASIGSTRKLGDEALRVWGKIPLNHSGWVSTVTIGNPALYTAQAFRHRLSKLGVNVKGTARSRGTGEKSGAVMPTLIAEHLSVPLHEIATVVNKQSQNLFAEILLRTLGKELKGAGTDAAGLKVIEGFLKEAGVDVSSVELRDGSGLSRMNRITPEAETSLLAHMAKTSDFQYFFDSLAVAGKDGTLESRMLGTKARANVFAKTGSLKDAVALGGYLKTLDDRTLAFTILVNDYKFSSNTARKLTDRICNILVQTRN